LELFRQLALQSRSHSCQNSEAPTQPRAQNSWGIKGRGSTAEGPVLVLEDLDLVFMVDLLVEPTRPGFKA
jgi:hypothetical protein